MDWLTIQWARACEEELKPSVDELERAVVERDERGRLADPLGYLYARAVKLLTYFDAPVHRWIERVRRVKIGTSLIVIALGALAFPFARVNTILGDGVNLAGPFLFFLVTQIFFLTCALILACLVILLSGLRRLLGRQRSISFSEKAVQVLSSVVGSLAIWATRRFAPTVYAFFGKPSTERFAWNLHSSAARKAREEKSPEQVQKDARRKEKERRAGLIFWDVIFSKPRVVAFWGGALSHTFWASCSLCVLLILVARMQGNRYDYCWHTSLEDERVVKQGVDFLGAPIAAFGGTVPSDSDVAALFTDDLSTPKEIAEKDAEVRRTAAETRARWSYFLLAIVFTWCVVPRLILIGIYYLLYRHALRDFRPSLDDEYFKRIIDRAEDYCSTTKAVMAPEREDDRIEEKEPIAAPAAPIWNRAEAHAAPKPTPSASEAVAPEPVKALAAPSSATLTPPQALPERVEEPSPETSGVDEAPGEPLAAPREEPQESVEAKSAPEPEIEPAPVDEPASASAVETRPEHEPESIVKSDASDAAVPEALPAPEASGPLPHEAEEERLLSALVRGGGLAERVFAFKPTSARKSGGPAVALCYDVQLEPTLLRELLGAGRELALFGDVADFDEKKKFKTFLDEKGTQTELCAIFADVGLPPARHFVRFMRDVLTPGLGETKIVVVLSGGERMRLKFSTSPSAVTERVADWTQTLETIAQASGKTIEPTFFYDAELNLPEPRARLQGVLRGEDEGADAGPRDLKKWDAATALVLKECGAIFDAPRFATSAEAERLRVANACGEIFKIYADELDKAAFSGRQTFKSGLGSELASKLAASSLGEGLASRVEELGLPKDFLESRLMAACGLSAKMRTLAGKVSPKCALVAASVGVSAPLVVAFAPLFGGALSATALLSTLGAVGSALPASLTTGAAAGVLGAFAPETLRGFRARLVEKLTGKKPGAEGTESEAGDRVDGDRVASASTLACSAAAWSATLELQGLSEEDVVATLPEVLKPFEESPLATSGEIEDAFAGARRVLEGVPRRGSVRKD